MTRLLEATYSLKYKAALSIAYGAGLRASEIVHLKITDIDSDRMIIRVEDGNQRPEWSPCGMCSVEAIRQR